MSVELKMLISSGPNPCIHMFYLDVAIGCAQRDCNECIWEVRSNHQTKLLELIPILEIEPDG